MDDGFQVVQKEDGQFQIVKLEPVKKTKSNTKSKQECSTEKRRRIHTKDCQCIQCHPNLKRTVPKVDLNSKLECDGKALGKFHRWLKGCLCVNCNLYEPWPESDSTDVEETPPRFSAMKNYTRVRKNNIKPKLIQLRKNKSPDEAETVTVDASVTIKADPELNVVDSEYLTERKRDDVAERLMPTGDEVIKDNKSIRIVRKISNSEPDADTSTMDQFRYYCRPELDQLTTENIKCNICGMVFPRHFDQASTLRDHFMSHKSSVVKVVKKYKSSSLRLTDDYYAVRNSTKNAKPSEVQQPVILNTRLPTIKSVAGNYNATRERKKQQFQTSDPPLKQNKLIFAGDLPEILKRRKFVNVKPLPDHLLKQLRWSQSDQTSGNSHVIIGNTLIKPIKQTKVTEVKGIDDKPTSDVDDDVQIIEQEPELIVIDDNDDNEDEKPK